MARLVLITPPAQEAFWLSAFKEHHGILVNDHDAAITTILAGAIGYLDGGNGILGRCLLPQTWEYRFGGFPDYPNYDIEIPLPPLISVDEINYMDTGDVLTPVDVGDYTVNLGGDYPATISPAGGAYWGSYWPTTSSHSEAVRIQFTAGYEDGKIPPSLKLAILQLAGHYFENREAFSELNLNAVPMATKALINPYRIRVF